MKDISLILRTKNSGRTLGACLASVFNQSVLPAEIILVDSGSTDTTFHLAAEYGCKIVHYPIHERTFNYSHALNLGIQASKGTYIFVLSSHVELLHPQTLYWLYDSLLQNPEVKAVSTARTNQHDKQTMESIKPEWVMISKDNFKGAAMYNYCSFLRKSDWELYPFNEQLPTCEDQEWMWYWMQNENAKSVILTQPAVYYSNPYYNSRKDIQEHYICGRYVYSYYNSWSFILDLLFESFRLLKKRRNQKAKYRLLLALGLLKFKLLPPGKLLSVYNRELI